MQPLTVKGEQVGEIGFAYTYNQLPDEYNAGVPYSHADGTESKRFMLMNQPMWVKVGLMALVFGVVGYYVFKDTK